MLTLTLALATASVLIPSAPTPSSVPGQRSGLEAWVKETDDESTFKRWGMEVVLFKRGLDVHLFNGDKAAGMATAGDLLKRYGPAYLS